MTLRRPQVRPDYNWLSASKYLNEFLGSVVSEVNSLLTLSRKNNHEATGAPGISNDISEGYKIGSEWLIVSTGKWYKCRDSSEGAAVWDLLN